MFLPDEIDYSTMPDHGELDNSLQLTKQIFAIPTLPSSNARDGTHNTRPLSELGNAERLNDTHGGNLHYVSGL